MINKSQELFQKILMQEMMVFNFIKIRLIKLLFVQFHKLRWTEIKIKNN